MVTLFKNAKILTMKDNNIVEGELLVVDNRIAYLGKGKEYDVNIDKIIDCSGNLLMPGFKNAHAHTAMVFARSASDDLPLQKWLYDCIFPMEEKLTPEIVYELTRCGILEYLSSGITAAMDMYFYPPAIAKAGEDMGFRTCIVATSMSESLDLIQERYINFNKPNSLTSYVLGIHAEYTTPLDRIKDIATLANKLHAPVYLHVGETESEVQGCIDRYGKRPLELLDEVGFFNYGGGGYHCNFLSDSEIDIAKKRHFSIITCPGSNLKLASGIAPIYKYQQAGLNIAIGTDGAGSNNSLDMFKEMYLVSCLQKVVNKDPSVMDGFDVLKMATIGGAKAMNLNDADILDVGKLADIIMIDLSRPSMRPINNIPKNIVYSGSKDIVKMTMINGKILYMGGQYYLPVSVEEIYQKSQEITEYLKS